MCSWCCRRTICGMGKHSMILAAGLVLATATSLQSGLGPSALAAGTTRYVITDLMTPVH